MKKLMRFSWCSALLGLVFASASLPPCAAAQDYRPPQQQDQDDPPSRVARLGYMEGSVSFQPAGEEEWVQAVDNRPLTTGDKLWADKDSRAELQLGSAVIRLSANTGISFLNLDDRTAQIQLSSGAVNIRVRRLDRDDVFEIDTPNLAFTLNQPGNYRLEASEDGSNTAINIRSGGGEATGNGQTYTLHEGQRGNFSGSESLNADVEQIGGPDQFDSWADSRERRHEESRSAQYVSHDVVGYDDLDEYGDWRDDANYGHVWYPNRVSAGWAPYHEGHWDWIDPWGYTWVDDSPWGYAPFHYGRWVSVGGRWGWVAGPVAVRPVYAPALVVFVGGGGGVNVGWFPLGPREVYVPSYQVSRGYVERVNVSNTTVNTTTVTNVYNTTIINKTTNVTNVTYVNRNVQGAVTAVPQRTFAGAQPVGRAAVQMNAREIAAAPVTTRVAVAPTRESVLGARANTANHVTAPPAAVMNRQVIAKSAPPPPPVPFAQRQQAMAAHPGQPLARREVQTLRPAAAAAAPHPMVKVAPPGKPATPTTGHPGNAAANQPGAGRPGQPAATPPNQPNAAQPNAARPGQPAPNQPNQPANNRPGNQPAPAERPGAANPAQPNRPGQPGQPPSAQPNQPATNNRPQPNRPTEPPAGERAPAAQPNQPTPQPNRPGQPPAKADRPPSAQPGQPAPNNRPEPNRPEPNRPETNRPEPNRPAATPPNNRPAQPNNQPEPNRPQPNRPAEPPARNDRPPAAQPSNRPAPNRPAPNQPAPERNQPAPRQQTPSEQRNTPPTANRPQQQPERQQPRPQTPEEKKRQQEQQKPPGE
ncbi:MAG TPA: DUF6600 domain-containing protein [Candidatus Sulfotelmatobacter sp.]